MYKYLKLDIRMYVNACMHNSYMHTSLHLHVFLCRIRVLTLMPMHMVACINLTQAQGGRGVTFNQTYRVKVRADG